MKSTMVAMLGIVALTTILVVPQSAFAQYNYNPPSTTPSTSPAPAIPEFGPVVSIVFAIAILGIVVFAAKTRVIPRL
jgi:predicted secreted protein with PEFG-CTERM motif